MKYRLGLIAAISVSGVIAASLFALHTKAASTETILLSKLLTILLNEVPAAAADPSESQQLLYVPERPDDKFFRSNQKLPDRYIVVLNDEVVGPRGPTSRAGDVANELSAIHGGRVARIFTHAINGFSAEMSEGQAIALSKDPRVAYVEEDSEIRLSGAQTNAPWGLDRIDQPTLPLNTIYNYNQTGTNVRVYVLDSGIRTTHSEFGGRASLGVNLSGGTGEDCNGHGTHVAGIVGGTNFGVAKSTSLVSVRVFDCFGFSTTSTIIAGVDWTTTNAVKPAIANMSLGDVPSMALDLAVNNSINSGITYIAAAGNNSQDACNVSPARLGPAITVGASNISDQRWFSSNFGICIDLFAPGVDVPSAWIGSDTDSRPNSGTSMAAPHVAGAAAMYLEANPNATPGQVRAFLYGESTKGVIASSSSTNNHLLFTSWVATPILQANNPPTASFTYNCAGQTCTFDGTGSGDTDGSVVSYFWNFGDGQSGTGSTVQHTFNFIGNTTVSLNVLDNAGEASIADSKNITIFNTPVGNNVRVDQEFGLAYMSFSEVTTAGNTTFSQLFSVPPNGNTICTGCPMFDVSTTAVVVPPTTISLDVPQGITEQEFNSMSMLRYINFDTPPTDVTIGRITNPDGTREILGRTSGQTTNGPNTHIGTFAIATQLAAPPPQSPPTLSNTAVTPVLENGIATLTGNISDPNAGDTFTLTVDWGDGSVPQQFNYAAGTTAFSETHRYLDNPSGQPNGAYLLTMTLADSAGGTAAPWSLNAGVSNVAPTLNNINATPSAITVGGSTTISGTIIDPGTLDSLQVTIHWQDPTASTVIDLPPGSTSFTAQHQYDLPGTYNLNINVRDKDFAASVYNPATTVTVAEASAPELTNVAISSPINENGSASLSGNITSQNAGETFDLVVSWGDGSQQQVFNYQAGTTSFNESHQYLDNGVYQISLVLTSSSGGQDTESTSTTVVNLAPVISNLQLDPNPITAGGSTTLTASSADTGTADNQTVLVNWGDGSTNTMLGLSAGETAISSSHIYTQAGDYSVEVTATDKDGGQVTESAILTVVAPPPTPSPTPVPPRVGNAPSTEIGLNGSAFAGLVPGPDNGRLYGVTYDGPVSDNEGDDQKLDAGTIYSVDRDLTNRIDHYFFNDSTDGHTPYNELTWVPSEGKFFGATSDGAAEGGGKIFTFDPATDAFALMPGGFTGEVWGSLVLVNGYLYGTVQSFPEECVFRLTPSNFAVSFMHCVTGGPRLQGVTYGSDGWLYGNSLYSGLTCDPDAPGRGCGEIFKLRPWNDGEDFDPQYQVIFQFQFYGGFGYPCPPGDKFCVRFPVTQNYPVQKLVYGSDGKLYGSTFYSVFRLDPHALDVEDSFRTLWNDGGGIQATVVEGLDGRLYFTDYGGGSDGVGRIASMNKDGSGVFELRNFDRNTGSTATGPWGRLFHDPTNGRLYGTTEYTNAAAPYPGTAFFIDIPPTEYRLSGSPDGTAPVAVDDALDIFVNGALFYTDGIAPSGNRPPIPVPEGYFRPGDIIRFEVRDVYGDCRMLSPIYLVDNLGNSLLMTPGIEITCGWPAGDNGVVFSDTFTIPGVANSAPVISSLTAPTALSENGVARLNFVVGDSNAADTLTVTVDWGDGSPNTVVTTPAAVNIPFELFHQYLDDDPTGSSSDSKLITVTVTDGLAIDTESHGILINNLNPFIGSLSAAPSPINVGESTTLSGSFGDTGTLDSFTILIDWGDGTQPSQLSRPPGSTAFDAAHQYNTAGNFTINVTLQDDDGGEATSSANVTVDAIPPPPVPAAPTDLTAIVQATTQVDLSWMDNADNETEFRIERCSGGKKCNRFSVIGTVPANALANRVAFSDITTSRNTNYHYRVQACNSGGCSAYTNTAVVKTPRK